YIASGSDDRTIRVWDSTTGETVAGPFTGHTDSVRSVAFSPDGRCIASGSHDGAIRLWSVTTRRAETIGDADFTDDSVINDEGWICGGAGELIVWIPPIHRAHLHRPSSIWVAGENETRVDFSASAHGHSWTTCINT
ncbi:WD40-repeat-containing domain protein, partial [Lactarius akahatsu]